MDEYFETHERVKVSDQKAETVRFYYEFGHVSESWLVQQFRLDADNLKAVIKEQKWERKTADANDSKSVNELYSKARKTLTVEIIKHTFIMFHYLSDIELCTVEQVQRMFKRAQQDTTQELSIRELNLVTKMISTLNQTKKLYSEAIEVPALTDRNVKNLVESMEPRTIEELERYLKDRNIPIPEIEIEDLESDFRIRH